MSATNTTTNYNLPIFIETDKPAWLVDFNGAMRSIDAQMKINADAIATKSPILTFNDTTDIDFTKSGDIITANLTDGVAGTISRALVKPITAPASQQLTSIDNTNTQQMVSIGSGLSLANNTLSAIDLNLTDTGSVTATSGTSGVSVTTNTLRYALNSDKTVGKIYGKVYLRNTTGSSSTGVVATINTNLTVASTGEAYTIEPVGETPDFVGAITMQISASGAVSFLIASRGGNSDTHAYIFPCIYFFKNFGDTPTP